MSKLEQLLLKSITSINEGFEKAQSDLYEIVSELNRSLTTLGNFEVTINTLVSEVSGDVYRLIFDPDVASDDTPIMTIVTIRIPSFGYPIQSGRYHRQSGEFIPVSDFYDREGLNSHFEKMLEDPTSPLIQAVGFALRKKR